MGYYCEGRRRTVGSDRADLKLKIANIETLLSDTDADARAPLVHKLKELSVALDGLVNKPDEEILGRSGCGHDLTPQMNAIPADGDVYNYECPACGNTGSMKKTPLAELEAQG